MTKKDIMCICEKCLKDISTCRCTYDTEIKDIGTLSAIIRNVKHHNKRLKSDLEEKELLLSKAQDRLSKLEQTPALSIVMRSLQEKKMLIEQELEFNIRSREMNKDSSSETQGRIQTRINLYTSFIGDLEEIINQNFA